MSMIALYDGTVVDSSSRATAAQCLPYQCGMDQTNLDALLWCAQSNEVAARTCVDPECAPYVDKMGCPAVAAPPIQLTLPPLPVLTPANIVQPMPDLLAAVAPIPLSVPSCSLWCDLNALIAQHPAMAVLILAGATALLWRRK